MHVIENSEFSWKNNWDPFYLRCGKTNKTIIYRKAKRVTQWCLVKSTTGLHLHGSCSDTDLPWIIPRLPVEEGQTWPPLLKHDFKYISPQVMETDSTHQFQKANQLNDFLLRNWKFYFILFLSSIMSLHKSAALFHFMMPLDIQLLLGDVTGYFWPDNHWQFKHKKIIPFAIDVNILNITF